MSSKYRVTSGSMASNGSNNNKKTDPQKHWPNKSAPLRGISSWHDQPHYFKQTMLTVPPRPVGFFAITHLHLVERISQHHHTNSKSKSKLSSQHTARRCHAKRMGAPCLEWCASGPWPSDELSVVTNPAPPGQMNRATSCRWSVGCEFRWETPKHSGRCSRKYGKTMSLKYHNNFNKSYILSSVSSPYHPVTS